MNDKTIIHFELNSDFRVSKYDKSLELNLFRKPENLNFKVPDIIKKNNLNATEY